MGEDYSCNRLIFVDERISLKVISARFDVCLFGVLVMKVFTTHTHTHTLLFLENYKFSASESQHMIGE